MFLKATLFVWSLYKQTRDGKWLILVSCTCHISVLPRKKVGKTLKERTGINNLMFKIGILTDQFEMRGNCTYYRR